MGGWRGGSEHGKEGGGGGKGIKLLSTSAVNTTCVQSTSLTTKGSVMRQRMNLALCSMLRFSLNSLRCVHTDSIPLPKYITWKSANTYVVPDFQFCVFN